MTTATEELDQEMAFDVLDPPVEQVQTFPQKMRWFALLQHARRELDERQDRIKEKIAELEPHLLEEMSLHGIERQTVEGLTIFPQADIYVSKRAEKEGVTTDMVVQALRDCGCGYMVAESFSASSLKAKVKEWKAEGIEVPEPLRPLLNIGETLKLATRKS